MIEKKIKIENEHGLHARPAAKFVQQASRFLSRIYVEKDGMVVNGKSIMGLMSLAAERRSTIILKADGEDEVKAIKELVKLVQSNFGDKKD